MRKSARKEHRDRFVFFLGGWGVAEAALDICIMSIFRNLDGATINPEVPVTLERKIGFLKRAYAEIAVLAPFEETAVGIAEMFAREKDLRNTIVHAAPLKIEPNGTAHYLRIRAKRGEHSLEVVTVKPSEWDRLMTVTAHLIADLLVLIIGLEPHYKPRLDGGDKSLGKRGMKLLGGLPVSKRLYDILHERAPFGAG